VHLSPRDADGTAWATAGTVRPLTKETVMPLLVLSAVISLVLAFTARKNIGYGVAAALGVLGIVQMVWAVTDGKGDDTWLLVPIGVAGLAVNLALVFVASRTRQVTAT
jgi:uncharacterized membrane protein HdeD (DUF308 family)